MLKRGCTGSSESMLVKMPHCSKSLVGAHFIFLLSGVCGSVEINFHIISGFKIFESFFDSVSGERTRTLWSSVNSQQRQNSGRKFSIPFSYFISITYQFFSFRQLKLENENSDPINESRQYLELFALLGNCHAFVVVS